MKRALAVTLAILPWGGSCSDHPTTPADPAAARLPDQAFDWTIQGLLSRDGAARKHAFDLCRRNWSRVKDRLPRLLDSPKLTERLAAAYLLAQLAERSDLPLLRRCLEDADRRVILIALPGIVRLQDRDSVPTLLASVPTMKYAERTKVLPVAARLDPERTKEFCLKLAGASSWAHRRSAAQTMAVFDDDQTKAQLVRMLDDDAATVRGDAARALGQRRVTTSRQKIIALTEDPKRAVRAAAAEGLARMRDPQDLDRILHLALEDEDKRVRIAATEAFAHYQEEIARPLLVQILEKAGEHRKVRYAALAVLRQHKSSASREIAQRAAADQADLKRMTLLRGHGAEPAK